MPPKKATSTTAKKATGAASTHVSYRDMIKDAILNLKERNGSSRQSIKKYVKANNKLAPASPNAFDSQFNKAIKVGVEKGDFIQPKGPSGPVKLAKKEKDAAAKPVAKKPAAATKTAAPKKTATKKADKAEKAEKPKTKKSTAGVKKPVGRPKANTAKPRKASTAAPAVVDKPKVVSVTKSGRKTTTAAKPAAKVTKRTAKKA
ncbi:linker histone H1 and H5 family-domain-containing protein [Aspergillus karnatakaensis]|uniref:histone H1/H5 family protein n=1 Tax=Aspergillus karnatakaensis TaxID=1810916 RepID=UPI003CCE49B1